MYIVIEQGNMNHKNETRELTKMFRRYLRKEISRHHNPLQK
jgi:hypothetical protein